MTTGSQPADQATDWGVNSKIRRSEVWARIRAGDRSTLTFFLIF